MGIYEERIFPLLLDRVDGVAISQLRKRCVQSARGRVLEIGFGTGKSLPLYHNIKKLTVVEPSRAMVKKAEVVLQRADFDTECFAIAGESLPFEAGAFDSVVSSLTLCSVRDVPAVLSELFRVLKVGGRFCFLEHVASENKKVLRRQRFLEPLQKRVGCGCHLTRETSVEILRAGFEIVEEERVLIPGLFGRPLSLFPFVVGVAVKGPLALC